MANTRFLQALNMLAGEAGKEIENAQAFQVAQNQRMQALQMAMNELDLKKRQVKLEENKFEHDKGQDLVSNEIAREANRIKQMEVFDKVKQKHGDMAIDMLGKMEQAFDAGMNLEDLNSNYTSTLNAIQRLAGLPITPPITHEKPPGPPIDLVDSENLRFKYIGESERMSKDYQTVQNNMVNIETAVNRMLNNPKDFNRIATDQVTITSLNKILDPDSVVRESEYERTPTNTSLINRAKGWFDKLKQGGAGVTQKDIVEIRDTAREMAELRRQIINKKLEKQIRIPAGRVGLDPEEVAPYFEPISSMLPQQGVGFQGAFSDSTVVSDTTKTQPTVIPSNKANDDLKKGFKDWKNRNKK